MADIESYRVIWAKFYFDPYTDPEDDGLKEIGHEVNYPLKGGKSAIGQNAYFVNSGTFRMLNTEWEKEPMSLKSKQFQYVYRVLYHSTITENETPMIFKASPKMHGLMQAAFRNNDVTRSTLHQHIWLFYKYRPEPHGGNVFGYWGVDHLRKDESLPQYKHIKKATGVWKGREDWAYDYVNAVVPLLNRTPTEEEYIEMFRSIFKATKAEAVELWEDREVVGLP